MTKEYSDSVLFCLLEYLRVGKEHGVEAAKVCLTHMKQEYGLTRIHYKVWNEALIEARQLTEFEDFYDN